MIKLFLKPSSSLLFAGIGMAFAGGLLLASPSARADTVTWSESAIDSKWDNALNWSDGMPQDGDDVVIFGRPSASGKSPTDLGTFSNTIHSLTLNSGPNGDESVTINKLLRIGAGGVTNHLTTSGKSLTFSSVYLAADQVWSGTRTIFVSTVTAGSAKLTMDGNTMRFDGISADWSSGLEVRGSAGMNSGIQAQGDTPATPWGTGTLTLVNQRLDGTTAVTPKLAFGSSATQANALTLANEIVLTQGGSSTRNFNFDTSADTASNTPRYNLTGTISSVGGGTARSLEFTSSGANKSGTFALSGANTYSLGTVVDKDTTLLVNGTHTGAGAYTIKSGGTFGGYGTVETASEQTITLAAGSKLSPGDALSLADTGVLHLNVGTSTVDLSGAVTVTNSEALLFTLSSTRANKVSITGGLNIGNLLLEFDDFAFTLADDFAPGTYTLFESTNLITGSLGTALTGALGGYDAVLYLSEDGRGLKLTVVPEPSTYVLLFVAAALVLAKRRRIRNPY